MEVLDSLMSVTLPNALFPFFFNFWNEQKEVKYSNDWD